MQTNHIPKEIVMMPEFVMATRHGGDQDYAGLSPQQIDEQLQRVVRCASYSPALVENLPSHIEAAKHAKDREARARWMKSLAADVRELKARGAI